MTQVQPTVQPKLVVTRFGFNRYAERFNGRAAMVGFAALLIIEYITGQNPLAALGLVIN
ncbi:chlorophyll a/b-binding protein [Chamaesiphon sp.]|uniref:chlorophyll a/b-binding protein n=1 Tax=Chamaesiphon sp. TaxID=2814140 RepID=UPI003593E141